MTLEPGTRIGNLEIVAPLGAGGMGEVYRATDLRLQRTVAVKALGEAFAQDPERIARFEREARILASLHHAHIATIHGIEDLNGRSYLVLEFVEGQTLADRLARGPLDADETLAIGVQIASAIDAAHEQGVVHRDLKPGNVMLTPAGEVKVLDFGLARSADPAAAGPADLSASPTVALGATAAGVILGTAPYMSPEQARGKTVDRRADVWALGCILYECLSGRQAFPGETSSDVIARILEREPDWTGLPGGSPARLRDVVRRCLTKNPDERPRDVGDLRRELQAIALERSSPRGATPDDGLPSVAVLYFDNLSADPESDYFCAGITEDILTDLSKIKGMRVASRNAVARYRGQTVEIAAVARDLSVRAVLEGSVRRAGDRVRISAQLISADGFHLWAERYDRTLEDVFAVQEEIASAIAAALRGALTPAETERIGQSRPKDVRAYDLYLKGREQYDLRSAEGLREAERLFEEAIAVDPDYALAHAGIADTVGQYLQWGLADDPETAIARGLAAARRAIHLNPKLAEAHKAEGLVLRFSGDRTAAAASIRRAIEADPRYTPALGNLGVEMYGRGDIAAAERLQRRATEIEPDQAHMILWVSTIEEQTGRAAAADASLGRILDLAASPFYTTAVHMIRAWRAVQRERFTDVPQHVAAAREAGGSASNLAMVEAWLAGRAGDETRARQWLDEWGGANDLGLAALTFASISWMRLGEIERALEIMQRRVIVDLAPVFVRLVPQLHPLLDFAPFAPRRLDATLIWPLEAPMVPAAVHRVFRETRIESGLPEGSDILASV